MMDVIFIEPICTAAPARYSSCFACVALMLLSGHHHWDLRNHQSLNITAVL